MKTPVYICCLCLQAQDPESTKLRNLDESFREKLKIALITLENYSNENKICHVCKDRVECFFMFKSTYLSGKKSKTSMGDKVMNSQSKDSKLDQSCHFCKVPIELKFRFSVLNILGDNKLTWFYENHFPALMIADTFDCICLNCKSTIENFLEYMASINCLENEAYIEKQTDSFLLNVNNLKEEINKFDGGDMEPFQDVEDDQNDKNDNFNNIKPEIECIDVKPSRHQGDIVCSKDNLENVNIQSKIQKHGVCIDQENGDKYTVGECALSERSTTHDQTDVAHPSKKRIGKLFKCLQCNFVTKYKNCIERHNLIHMNNEDVKIFKCEKCLFQSKHRRSWRRHKITHKTIDEVTSYPCESCPFITKCKENLKKHIRVRHSPHLTEIYECEECPFKTKAKLQITKHLLQHTKIKSKKMYKCIFCEYHSKRRNTLKQHMLTHRDPEELPTLRCEICSFITKTPQSLKKHVMNHGTMMKPLKCELSEFEVQDKSNSECQSRIDSNIDNKTIYKCEQCRYETYYLRSIKMHVLTHDNDNMRCYECFSCGFRTQKKASLRNHLVIHQNNVHACHLCSFETRYMSSIKRHLLYHTNGDSIESLLTPKKEISSSGLKKFKQE